MSSYSAKITLTGDGAVGKTSLRNNYMGKSFNSKYIPTLGADISVKEHLVSKDDKAIFKYSIWDIAGQIQFSKLRRAYFEGTNAFIMVFDLCNEKSFLNIDNWLNECSEILDFQEIPIVLVGNKVDLRGTSVKTLDPQQGIEKAQKMTNSYAKNAYEVSYIETSALTGKNVKLIFETISKHLLNDNKI